MVGFTKKHARNIDEPEEYQVNEAAEDAATCFQSAVRTIRGFAASATLHFRFLDDYRILQSQNSDCLIQDKNHQTAWGKKVRFQYLDECARRLHDVPGGRFLVVVEVSEKEVIDKERRIFDEGE